MLKRVREVAIDMRRVGVHAAEVLVHDLQFGLEHVVLLARAVGVLAFVLEAVDRFSQLAALVLDLADVVDRCRSSSAQVSRPILMVRTFGEDLPLARLRASTGWNSFVQVFEKVLHLTPTLSLSQFVTNAQFRRAAVVANRTWHALILDARDGPMLECVVVSSGIYHSSAFRDRARP